MAKNARIGRATLYRIWKEFVKNKLIIKTRDSGDAKPYKLNALNPFVQKIIELDNEIMMNSLRARSEKVLVGVR